MARVKFTCTSDLTRNTIRTSEAHIVLGAVRVRDKSPSGRYIRGDYNAIDVSSKEVIAVGVIGGHQNHLEVDVDMESSVKDVHINVSKGDIGSVVIQSFNDDGTECHSVRHDGDGSVLLILRIP